ncbi:MAG: hypothetical protein K2G55_06730 [Lachnospiraceae bacterium]|nr:hypothetical protein [Lachnospiraceae bacterium]MDE7201318.1 hypothetical protein [Lachnospiraceae bacterium]
MKMNKKIITTAAALSLAALILQPAQIVSAASAIPLTTLSGTTISPLADDIKWVYYTTDDGKTYKRLYNYSTGEWIGEWIYVSG